MPPRTSNALRGLALAIALALPRISGAAVPPYQPAPPAGIGTCSAATQSTNRFVNSRGVGYWSFSEEGYLLDPFGVPVAAKGPLDYESLSQMASTPRYSYRVALQQGLRNYIEIEAPAAAATTATTVGWVALRLVGLAALTASTFLDSVHATWWLQDNDPCNLLAPAKCPPGTVPLFDPKMDPRFGAAGVCVPAPIPIRQPPTPTTPPETGCAEKDENGQCIAPVSCAHGVDENGQCLPGDPTDPRDPRGPHNPLDPGGNDSPIPGQGHFIECIEVYWPDAVYLPGSGPGGITPYPGQYAGSVCRGGGGGGWRWIPAY